MLDSKKWLRVLICSVALLRQPHKGVVCIGDPPAAAPCRLPSRSLFALPIIFNYTHWDPSPEMFSFPIPILGRPILWYGFFFALGFAASYYVFLYLLRPLIGSKAKQYAEGLSFYVILGTLIGARLFDVFFYQSPSVYLDDPWMIVKVWEGGLASHGGVLGIIAAVYLFCRKHRALSFLKTLDLLSIVCGLAAACIRIGNFVNQEILGTITNVPWAVVFGHPADHSVPAPRHPVQLYEAVFYLALFAFLFFYVRKKGWREGRTTGLTLILIFAFRFFIEFFKEEQSRLLHAGGIDMAQFLSLPLLLIGFYLAFRRR
ncbi:MAG: prolipoprotein diacylglyceryl transferase [Verrucomicrobia bacterium]|nr:prolipoprotein diacylglyceryl transferase [Verrucomicrobiota bacterium]